MPCVLTVWSRFLVACSMAAVVQTALAAELTVSAAASLSQAFKDLAPVFEAANPGTLLILNFGASGALLQQVLRGAPVDVLATADEVTMDAAQAQLRVNAHQRVNFAGNTLVVVVPAASSLRPQSSRDLLDPRYKRIAVGVPASVPAGRYAQAAFEAQGIWTALQPKVIGAQHVRQALDYVSRGEVDAALVYATDAALMPDRVAVALTVRTAAPIVYPAAVVKGSRQADLALRFVNFLLTPPAQAVLARHGFLRP